MLYFLLCVGLFLGLKCLSLSVSWPVHLWTEIRHVRPKAINWERFLKCLEHFFMPGLIAQWSFAKSAINRLPLPRIPITASQFYALKQVAFMLGGVLFLAWLWFGHFSWEEGAKFFFYGPL